VPSQKLHADAFKVISVDIDTRYPQISAIYLKIYDIPVTSGDIQGYPRPVDILGRNCRHQLVSISIGRVVLTCVLVLRPDS